jgi:LacI family transcriptional regulator
MHPTIHPPRQILIAVQINWQRGRDLCRGIFAYARPARPWSFRIRINTIAAIKETLRGWPADGMIGQLGHPDLTRFALDLGIPCVNIYGGTPFDARIPQVGTSDKHIGHRAADHLLERGYTSFAYFGLPGEGFQSNRRDAFVQRLAANGHTCAVFAGHAFNHLGARPDPATGQPDLHRWLLQLPRGTALFACDDLRAAWIYDACRLLAIAMPEDLALLGVGDDDLYCNQPFPPLSSIQLPGQDEGFEAARLLDQRLCGKTTVVKPKLLAPVEVRLRGSTERPPSPDPQVNHALHWLREHACEDIGVDDVAAQTGISRRVLEQRFRRHLATSVHQEIRATRINQVKRLLAETSLTLERIAERTGTGNAIRLCAAFKQATGQTPARYREAHRPR